MLQNQLQIYAITLNLINHMSLYEVIWNVSYLSKAKYLGICNVYTKVIKQNIIPSAKIVTVSFKNNKLL